MSRGRGQEIGVRRQGRIEWEISEDNTLTPNPSPKGRGG